MNGYSLTATVVAMGGPAGPRYYPESFSAVGAETLAESLRSTGTAAVAMPVHLRLPDPGEMLRSPREQLFAVVRDDPFDWVEADVLEDRDRKAAGNVPRGSTESIEPDGDEDVNGEPLGDESTYIGTAEFERLPNRWTVWVLEAHPAARPDLRASHRTFEKALRQAERMKGAFGYKLCPVIIGPGHGGVRVDNITLWPNAWVVRTITDEEVYPEDAILELNGDPITRQLAVVHAEEIAATDSCGTPACPIVFLPYRPASKGGAR